jgi:hypothetical protein
MGPRKIGHVAALAIALAVAGMVLSGCFDIVQNIGIGRSGTGHYRIAVSAQGIVGDALKNANIINTTHNHAELSTTYLNGKTTRAAKVDFQSLSDVALSDETMSLTVRSRDLFGLGPTHAAFRCRALVDKAKSAQSSAGPNGLGEQIARSILGDHTYVFSVTVPGSLEHIAPVTVGNQIYQPDVTGDFYHGHTVTWRLPLYAIVDAKALDFEVDFAAMGLFSDARTQLVAKE